jgi:predicted RNA-binding protein associated with RNAse of E/G family
MSINILSFDIDAENVFEGNVHEAEGLFVDLLTHGIECMDRDQGTFSCLTMAMAEDLLTTTAYDYEVSKRLEQLDR